MMRRHLWLLSLFLFWAVAGAFAADTILTWPPEGKETLLRFTVGKFRQIASTSGQSDYVAEALAENLSQKAIPSASFYLYLLDKSGKRVGEGYLEVTDLAAGKQAKLPVTAHVMGSWVSLELKPQHLPSDEPPKVKMSVASAPSGASLKLDSLESGVTPQVLMLAPGKHTLEFSKEGYVPGSTTLDIAENAMPGRVDLELPPLTVDTVILRDGTVLQGDLVAVTASAVTVNVKGKPNKLDRNRVARIVLVERKPAEVKPRSATRSKK